MKKTSKSRQHESRPLERRLAAAKLFAAGVGQSEVARVLSVSRQAVSRWHKVWTAGGGAKGGEEAMRAANIRRGPDPTVSDAQLRRLAAAAKRDGLTTFADVVRLQARHGMDLSRDALKRNLRRLKLWP